MYTEDEGKKLGVNGWVKNTRQGTVVGQVQGPYSRVNAMKAWLSKVGSPSSRIDRAEFSNERDIPQLNINGFVSVACSSNTALRCSPENPVDTKCFAPVRGTRVEPKDSDVSFLVQGGACIFT
ncbi:hypothetical protein DPEC_G00177360 [Dallia pectoralis]|uniref:Uncharacterized protein n=1 Tax=Dallia pectoralis TaxID=75939 RepID=A0ACC2GF66_DALPE|nr:hypothetical protein DPEC_G00177360 [Dallia pectoralis]